MRFRIALFNATLGSVACMLIGFATPSPGDTTISKNELSDFAKRYTAAWCSRVAENVAAFFDENGTLTINDGEPNVGRAAIANAAQGFIAAFPDYVLYMDGLETAADEVIYHWTFVGTNSGPGGTGNAVRFSGFERWTMSPEGLIAYSSGNFDADEYARQLQHGVDGAIE
jgi:hypothetical protein